MERIVAHFGASAESVAQTLAVGLLVAARVIPLVLFAPWVGLRQAPATLRTAVSLALTVALVPLAAASAPTVPTVLAWMAPLCLREFLLGLLFVLAIALPFYAFEWVGHLIDLWRGSNLAEVLAPPTGDRTSPLGDLYLMSAVVVFLGLGGHRAALCALAETFAIAPVGELALGHGLQQAAFYFLRLSSSALGLALSVAVPAAAAIVLAETALGLLARSAPQIPVFFVGMPLRATLGLIAALLSFGLAMAGLPPVLRSAVESATDLFRLALGR